MSTAFFAGPHLPTGQDSLAQDSFDKNFFSLTTGHPHFLHALPSKCSHDSQMENRRATSSSLACGAPAEKCATADLAKLAIF